MHARWIMRLGCVIILTLVFMGIYGAGQQILRESANEPQTWLAETAAQEMNAGKSPADVVSRPTEIGNNLRPFTVIYDRTGKPVASDATLGGQLPQIPVGVLRHSEGKPYYAITWQPTASQRFASVSVKTNSGYVMVARSLHDVEHRKDLLLLELAAGWAFTLAALGGVLLLHHSVAPRTE